MKKVIYNPTEEEKAKNLKKIKIKAEDFKSGLFIGYNQDKDLSSAFWGSPKQLACLYLDLQDRMPEGVIEYANMIRESAKNDFEYDSLETQTPANNRLN